MEDRATLVAALKARLLSLGGDSFQTESQWNINLDLSTIKLLLEQGKSYSAEAVKFRKGNMRQRDCHENCAWLSKHFKGYTWITGLALSKDGCWRIHSWCLASNKTTVVETTIARIAYYGIPAQLDSAFKDYF